MERKKNRIDTPTTTSLYINKNIVPLNTSPLPSYQNGERYNPFCCLSIESDSSKENITSNTDEYVCKL